MKSKLVYMMLLCSLGLAASGQMLLPGSVARNTPSKSQKTLQIGGEYTFCYPDYSPQNAAGFGLYADYDLSRHWGVIAAFHDVAISQHASNELTYEAGGRFHLKYGHLMPYIKAMGGVSDFRFGPGLDANPATEGFSAAQSNSSVWYKMYSLGAGFDIGVTKHINVRLDGEYQHWFAGENLKNALTPVLYSAGVAYTFHPKKTQSLPH